MGHNKKPRIAVMGTGYVGLVTGACLAELGCRVICIDNNKEKIKKLMANVLPIYEPGLKKIIIENRKKKRLFFSTEIKEGVRNSNIIFITVHTPTKKNGQTDLRYVKSVAKEIAKTINGYKIIVSKSTMPVSTGQKIKETLVRFCPSSVKFDVVSNPEFLKEGSAVKDFLKPDRIVVGVESKRAEKIMRQLYGPIKAPLIVTGIETSEIIKHACNAFLATKISFINAIANICEKNEADVDEVALALGMDKRIGRTYLKAGIGFGGSCLPKDVAAFKYIAEKSGYNFKLLKNVQEINRAQKRLFIKKIKDALHGLNKKKLGILGLSFKPDTDDMREAPSIDIIKTLLRRGAIIKVYDPVATEKAREIFKNKVAYCADVYKTVEDCDALVILTEWREFKNMNLIKIKKSLKAPVIIDGRNMFNPKKMADLGFYYSSVGKKTI